jgi:BirA family biotin operon repressor/biotin-[acetyl-CoA-carboxylase] ligase
MCEDLGTLYDLDRIRERLTPGKLLHAKLVSSTNDWAKREVESGSVHAPALVLADCQSAGRGRGANTWWSAAGNLFATFIAAQNSILAFGLVPLLAGLAVRRALVRVTDCDAIDLKWPNDLMAAGRKTAGLLCERLRHVDLIGVGVNVNVDSREAPAELCDRITSLHQLTGTAWNLTDIACEIGRELNLVLSVESDKSVRELLQEYLRHHWPTGKNVELIDTDQAPRLAGRCRGLDPQGRLIVETLQGVHAVLTGSIVSVTPATDTP